MGLSVSANCPEGFLGKKKNCTDINECQDDKPCGENTVCTNTNGSYYCQCKDGFRNPTGKVNFTVGACKGKSSQIYCDNNSVVDIQECLEIKDICGSNAKCKNAVPYYSCTCDDGFISTTGNKTFHHDQNATCEGKMLFSLVQPFYSDLFSFTTVSLMSYSNLENSTDGFFNGMKPQENQSFKINSKVATVTVSNRNTSHLKTPVSLTLNHLEEQVETNQTFHICVFWDSSVNGGSWSDRGCGVAESNLEYTSCSCNHLGTFAILTFEFHLIIWVFLSLSLICLFISILTFSMIHSIKSLRTTIHLHLCISLFIANLAFLAGISHFENQDSCTVVTGILHFSYLATFLWICLDSVQLFRMIMLVSNTNFKTLHMMAAAYGVPAVIVAISTLANSMGHGTERYCWVTQGFIWNYFGPACVIIIVNIFFFFITVWKLAQKFSSVNPDLDDLHKIEAFTISAVAQLFVLGNTWIFGSFQFQENHTAMAYLTIFGSLEGVTLFAVYCLFSRQVREEYKHALTRMCAPRKKSDRKARVSSYLQKLMITEFD
uniref:EGF-like module-containing mucin-like hormone receptor-like 1-like n=1 Tax=Neolamprologus brichardi TaxID=32507 RepID=A0A3Q4HVW9_NEOBR